MGKAIGDAGRMLTGGAKYEEGFKHGRLNEIGKSHQ
jgi:hypothetical protein